MSFGTLGAGGGAAAKAQDVSKTVLSGATGVIYTARTRVLPPSASWVKVSGNSNLTVASDGKISATAAIPNGTSQSVLVRGSQGNNAVEFQITFSVPNSAPVLSAAVGTPTSDTTATVGATTDVGLGTLYVVVSRGGQPSVDQIVNGLNAGDLPATFAASRAITSIGAKTFSVVGLLASTAYTAYFVQIDGLGQPSNVLSADPFTTDASPDTTAPTLSAATRTVTGATTATVGVSTDEANGTLYWFISTSATPPSSSNLQAGTGAVRFGSVPVVNAGPQSVDVTGLSASTTYYTHWLHVDAALNPSTILSGTGFTTQAAGAAPSNTIAPAITGTTASGSVLTVSTGTWTGAVSYDRQWQRETGVGTGIYADNPAAKGTTYTLVDADVGRRVRCIVTAMNANGSTPVTAAAVGPITAGSGVAYPAPLLRIKPGTTNEIQWDRGFDPQDGDFVVFRYSQDPTFATGITESAPATLYAATTNYALGVANAVSAGAYAQVAQYSGTRPASLNWSNVIKFGANPVPLLSVSSTLKDDLGPLADVITSNMTGPFAVSGADASALELSTTDAATTVTVRLVGNANLNASAKSKYDYSVKQTSLAGVASAPLTRSLTIAATDLTPDQFTFTDVSNATTSTQYTSNVIDVTGLGAGVNAPLSITGGEYAISTDGGSTWGAWASSNTTTKNGDKVKVRGTSSPNGSTDVNVKLTIGTVFDTYTIRTSGFTPMDLFVGSENGDFYDATDYSTMWQDTAGAVPVTGPNQEVRRWVGKKHGRVLTPLATNGPTTRVDGNGKKYLEFVAGSLQSLKDSGLVQTCDPTTGEMTVALAASVPDVTTTRVMAAWDDTSTHRVCSLAAVSASIRMLSFCTTTNALDLTGTLSANTNFTAIGRRSGNVAEAFKDNVSDGGTSGSGVIAKSTSPLYVGCVASGSYSTFNLYAGVVSIGRDLTSTERGNLHNWLANRL